MEKDGTNTSRKRRPSVMLIARPIAATTPLKDLIEGGLARLFALKIASEINLDTAQHEEGLERSPVISDSQFVPEGSEDHCDD